MRERVVCRAVVGLVGCALVACGGGSSDPPADAPVIDAVEVDATEIDAAIDSGPPASCDPLAALGQQGCGSGEKCTWITVQETPTYQGVLGCVPDGDVAVHGACVQGAAGASTGFDDCAAGLICITGECRDICGFDGSQSAACASVDFCARYQNLFSDGPDEAPYGACNVGCEPLTQLRSDGQPCGTGMGCYVLIRQTTTIAVCATAGTAQVGQGIGGSANDCVPGAMPRERGPSGGLECGGLCRMVDVTSTLNTASEGGVSPDSCNERWGVAQPSDTTAGESCRYLWSREPFGGLSPYSNTVGWCYKHAVYTWDTDGNGTQDAPFPRCANLTTGDVIAPFGNNDALYFWCLTKPVLLTGAIDGVKRALVAREPRLDRLTGWR